ncbi:MAG: DinB family protein [Cyclobacteriaceae bacterium]
MKGKIFTSGDIWSYMVWSDHRLIRILENISDEDYDREFNELSGNVRSKAAHIVSIYEFFLNTLEGKGPAQFPDKSDLSRLELVSLWKSYLLEMQDYITSSHGLVALPLAENQRVDVNHVFLDAAIHTIHHRGQILTMLRLMGKSKSDIHPGDTNMDYLMYLFAEKNEEIHPTLQKEDHQYGK